MMKRLDKILEGCGVADIRGSISREITALVCDSRKVVPGCAFVAVDGYACDGHDFVESAVEKGADVIIYSNGEKLSRALENIDKENLTLVKVQSGRYALAVVAANYYDNPSEKLTLVGITGTNGKTTTVTLLYDLFTNMGYSCGLLSTIVNCVAGRRTEALNTTSDPLTINRLLNEMVEAGCAFCFMEVSSIGVEQDRVAALHFKVGIFSNLTHDHLDYHKTFSEYLRCKKLFFDNLSSDAFAITNVDDRNGEVMLQNTAAQKITYSCRKMADHTCVLVEETLEGMLLRIDGREVWTCLTGGFNAYNLLAIYTCAVTLGSDSDEVLVALSSLKPAPGRMECIRVGNDRNVIIDYAHTPDALENVLRTLKEVSCGGHIICVFGCGGDRDATKRPEMGAIAQKYADKIIVTSDNSRTEDTRAIMAQIKGGMDISGISRSLFIEDREQAIRTALMIADRGDVILLAGKGHETYQIIGKEKRHFDEREIVASIMKEIQA